MRLKEPLFYTLAQAWSNRRGYRVMAVTTEKRSQFFGRYVDCNEGTHRAIRQCKGRFKTAEEAEACIQGIEEIRARCEYEIKDAYARLVRLQQARDKEIKEYMQAKGATS
jgi:hypothetical protein